MPLWRRGQLSREGLFFLKTSQLGSKWLSLLKKQDVKQGFWLTIEEAGLKKFYEKNGFQTITESEDKENIEWLCVYEPETGNSGT